MTTITNYFYDPQHRASASWIASGGTLAHTANGTDSFHQITAGAGGQGARSSQFFVPSTMPGIAGPWTFSCAVARVSGTTGWKFTVYEMDASNAVLVSNLDVDTFTVGDTEARYHCTYTPTNPSTVKLSFAVKTASAAGVCIVRQSMIQQGAEATDYFDGDSPNAAWTGTPHASTSVLTIPDTAPRPSRVFVLGSPHNIGPFRVGRR